MTDDRASITQQNEDPRPFMTSDFKLPKKLGFYKVDVQIGVQGRLFKNGAFERDLPPGRHRWWNPFAEYRVVVVESRVVLLPKWFADGRIPGPVDENGAPTPPARVQVPLRISVQLANIDVYLNMDQPLPLMQAMVSNFVSSQIGKLRYDQYHDWVNWLRDELQRYLQLNSVPRTGLQVHEVFVEEFVGTTEADKRQLRLYQRATEIKERVASAQGSNQIRLGDVETARKAAEQLGIAPLLADLLNSADGRKLIEADMELRKMALASGASGAEAFIVPQTPQGLPPGPAAYGSQQNAPTYPPSYLGPGSTPFDQTTPPQTGHVSTNWQPASTPTPTPTPAQPPAGGFNPITGDFRTDSGSPVDEARLQDERKRFPAEDFTVQETKALAADAAGNSAHVYEFTLTSKKNGSRIIFDLLSGYPRVPPVVWVKRSGDEHTTKYSGPGLHDWSENSWLSDLLLEIPK